MNLVAIDPKDFLVLRWAKYIETTNKYMVEGGYDPMTKLEQRAMAVDLEYEYMHSPLEHMGQILPTFSAWHGTASMRAQEEAWR